MRKKDSSRTGGFKVSYFIGEGLQGKKSMGITMGDFSLSEFGNPDNNNPWSVVGSLIRIQVINLISFKSSCLVCKPNI